ncbi:MAG: hypothetical protein Q9226_004216 [Calogaya cf. arnoldii]
MNRPTRASARSHNAVPNFPETQSHGLDLLPLPPPMLNQQMVMQPSQPSQQAFQPPPHLNTGEQEFTETSSGSERSVSPTTADQFQRQLAVHNGMPDHGARYVVPPHQCFDKHVSISFSQHEISTKRRHGPPKRKDVITTLRTSRTAGSEDTSPLSRYPGPPCAPASTSMMAPGHPRQPPVASHLGSVHGAMNRAQSPLTRMPQQENSMNSTQSMPNQQMVMNPYQQPWAHGPPGPASIMQSPPSQWPPVPGYPESAYGSMNRAQSPLTRSSDSPFQARTRRNVDSEVARLPYPTGYEEVNIQKSQPRSNGQAIQSYAAHVRVRLRATLYRRSNIASFHQQETERQTRAADRTFLRGVMREQDVRIRNMQSRRPSHQASLRRAILERKALTRDMKKLDDEVRL